MRSSRVKKTTTRMTRATRKQLKPALSRHTCHGATLRPQHGFNQLDLERRKEERGIEERGGGGERYRGGGERRRREV
jgi:hypothetical protein